MYPSTTAGAVVRPSIMSRALALVVIASILMAATMLAITPSTVGATEPEPTDNCGFRPIDLVFIIDRSGSMDQETGGNSRMEWAQIASKQLVDGLQAAGGVGTGGIHQVGVASFGDGDEAGTDLALGTSSAASVKTAIDNIEDPDGGTPFNLGMAAGLATMTAGARGMVDGVDVKQAYVFLSDGNPDPDTYTPTDPEKAAYLAGADVAYAVAIGPDGGNLGGGGTGVSYALMQTIAKPTPANFRFVVDADDLPTLFTDILEELNCPAGALEVAKSLIPNNDPGKFNLFIQNVAQANDRVHGGTTGEQPVDPGAFTVGESAGTGTSLGNYTSTIACVDQANGNAVVGTSGTGPTWSVTVANAADVLCTITNTRNTGKIELVKNLTPDDDLGRFDLWIGGMLLKDEAGEGGTTMEQVVNTGPVALAETADGETDLADYDASIACVDTANQNAAVPASGTTPNWSVTVTHNSDIVCTITNTRGTGKLEVKKALDPTDDPGDFNLLIDSSIAGTGGNVGHGGTTGEQTVSTGNHTVGESASGDTALADYASTIACLNGSTPVSATGSAPSWTVDVTKGSDIVCTITNSRRTGTIEVVKHLDPDDDPGKFDLLIDGSSRKDDATDEDTTGAVEVNTGTHTVGEAGGTLTDLDDYTSSIVCLNGQSPVTATKGEGASWSVNVTDGAAVVCTITNERETGELTVIKHLDPTDDPGLFDLRIDGAVEEANAGHGDGTGAVTVNTGTHTVGESAGTGTSIADYDSSVSCWDGDLEVAATPAAGISWSVDVTDGADVVCTITNTRETGWLTVEKDLDPGNDPGLFDLLINGESEFSDASDGDSTGQVEVNTGVNTVGEEAGSGTSLGNYSSSIECVDDGGEGNPIASGLGAGPLEVTVTDGEDVVCTINNERVTVGFDKALPEGHDGTVEPGETISYTLTVHVNDGDATGVVVTDTLPAGLTYVDGSAEPSEGFSDDGQELEWIVGDLAEGPHEFTYDATVDADASGDLENLGCVDADQNHDFPIFDFIQGEAENEDLVCEKTTVKVQSFSITKTNNAAGPVVAGTAIDFTLTFDVTNGPIDDVDVEDQLPDGLGNVTLVSDGGSYDAGDNLITWTNLDGIDDGDTLTYRATVNADAEAGPHRNVATITDGPCVDDGCEDDSTVTVRVPTLTVTKAASTDTIVISGPASAPVATPSVVTWTLSYTLANGPVTGAVITDAVPAGFVFLDAADGGTFAAGTVTWNLGTLTTSGSVSFRTTVNPATISRTAPTVNTAVIDSNETAPDDGTDSVSVTVQPPPLGGNPPLPNTAVATGLSGEPVIVPVGLLVAAFLAMLGTLAFANVRSSRRR